LVSHANKNDLSVTTNNVAACELQLDFTEATAYSTLRFTSNDRSRWMATHLIWATTTGYTNDG